MNKVIHSLKWVFTTTVLRRIVSFLIFLYVVRVFSRAELGVYREFTLIVSFVSLISVFSLNLFNIVERTKKYFAEGIQFILISSVIGSIILFALKGIFAEHYHSPDLYLYFLFGFWLVIPEALKSLVRSIHELDMNFKLLSIAETVNTIVYSVLTLVLLMIDLKFYYFVIAFYLGGIVELVIVVHPLRKKFLNCILEGLKLKFITPLKETLNKNISFLTLATAPTALNFFIAQAPILLLGLFYAPSLMGNYFVAFQLVFVPASLLAVSINQVLFPAFSLTAKEELPNKIKQFLNHVVVVLWLPLLVLGVLLKYWGYLIIGDHDIVLVTAIIEALIVIALFFLITNPLSAIPTVQKKPQYELYWSLCSIVAVCLTIYLLRGQEFISVIYYYTIIRVISSICYIIIVFGMMNIPLNVVFKLLCKGCMYNLPLLIILIFDVNAWLVIAGLVVSCLLIFTFEKALLKSLIARSRL
jgi:O-antigen/teichoic acid export membrane protein